MSGIFGFLNLDGEPACAKNLERMASILARRGPEAIRMWNNGSVGLGHTLLATTPEAVFESLPLRHTESECIITADVRLDNRDELLAALGIRERTTTIGDAEIILLAYLSWGDACVGRLLGDFAFALWDSHRRKLFCARDQFGMRPFYYHNNSGHIFAFASEPRAILVLQQIPYRVNESRIADCLHNELESFDKTSTFFEQIYRLPPAHTLVISSQGASVQRYWRLEPSPQLRLPSDEAYAEAFAEIFSDAVRCRLRSSGGIGCMLSGGMDSSSVVAIARTQFAEGLPTFSAIGPDSGDCIETRTIQAALTMDGLESTTVNYGTLDELMPDLADLTWDLDEPFEDYMTLPRAVYLAAHRKGIKVLLDGVSGDTILSECSQLGRLLSAGRWFAAYREAVGQKRFWGSDYTVSSQLYRSAVKVIAPNWVWNVRRRLSGPRQLAQAMKNSMINPDFAQRVSLSHRLETLNESPLVRSSRNFSWERVDAIDHPNLTVARERYDRVAASVAVEPRDPFLDRRLVSFCLSLPGEQLMEGGWPKIILRRAMADRLPDAVRWRRGKEHLGWSFTTALMARMQQRINSELFSTKEIRDCVSSYVDVDAACGLCTKKMLLDRQSLQLYRIAHLAVWLKRHARRPDTKF